MFSMVKGFRFLANKIVAMTYPQKYELIIQKIEKIRIWTTAGNTHVAFSHSIIQ